MNIVEKAYEFAEKKHKGQVDKSGVEYFFHCLSVNENVINLFNDTMTDYEMDYLEVLAYLHDVMEDCDVSILTITDEFGIDIACDLALLTHEKEDSYMKYIKQLSKNSYTRKVKIADILHNSDLTRLNKITIEDVKRNQKYMKAFKYLIEKENKMDTWNNYVNRNSSLKNVGSEEILAIQNTFHYKKFELRCTLCQLLNDIKSSLKEIFKEPEYKSFSKDVPLAKFKPPNRPESQKTENNEVNKMYNKKVIRTKEDKIRMAEQERLRELKSDKNKICPSCESKDTKLIKMFETAFETSTMAYRVQTEIYTCIGCECDYSVEYEGNNE